MNLLDLTGRVAIVTGAAKGIGRGCAEVLAAAGAHVVVADIDSENGESVAAAINDQGGSALFVHTDVRRAPPSRRWSQRPSSVGGDSTCW